jgi:hypothetical protein
MEAEAVATPETYGLPVRKLSSLDPPATCSFGLIGSTRSGKSTAMIWIWQRWLRDRGITIMMSGSPHGEIYGPMRRECAICPEFHSDLIKDAFKMNMATKGKYPTTFILDDMLDGKNSKALCKLLTIGRNLACCTVICAQELSILNAIGRTNLNYILCFRLNSDMAVEKVVKNYLRHALPKGTIAYQCSIYKALTTDHRFFVCDCLMNEIFLCKLDL